MTSSISQTSKTSRDNPYPHSVFWINGRPVSIEDIIGEKEIGRSPFEEHTFHFIKEWISGKETFQMLTSGSTGKPREISITRRQMTASAEQTAKKLKLSEISSALICIDTRYIGGKMMVVRSLTQGLLMMAVDPEANPLIKIPIDKCVQFTALVPYQIGAILESKHPHMLNNLDKLLIGGAPLSAPITEQLQRFQCECYETYGMTETVSHIALRLVNTKMKQQYFETLPGIEIRQDERGCLVASADYLASPVVTNDLVEVKAPGKFLWLGRWDTVINTGGVKVTPEKIEKEIEKIFNQMQFNHHFFIAALPDEKLGNKAVLVIEGVQFSSELLLQSLDVLKSTVSPFEFPKEVYATSAFSLTATKKIDRKQSLSGATLLSTLK